MKIKHNRIPFCRYVIKAWLIKLLVKTFHKKNFFNFFKKPFYNKVILIYDLLTINLNGKYFCETKFYITISLFTLCANHLQITFKPPANHLHTYFNWRTKFLRIKESENYQLLLTQNNYSIVNLKQTNKMFKVFLIGFLCVVLTNPTSINSLGMFHY